MRPIRKKILTDESARPLAVQIDYADWVEIERLLRAQDGTNNGNNAPTPAPTAGSSASAAHNRYPLRGSVTRYDEPCASAAPDTDWDALR